MSSKVAEANAKVHSLAMAVAVSFAPFLQILPMVMCAFIACDQLEALWQVNSTLKRLVQF